MYALIDCNNFFVSCERVFRPDLQKRPVAVLSNNDGCIIARSNEVKQMGVPMGVPFFKVKNILDQNHVVIFSCNFALYGDLSARVMQTIATLAPIMQVYSIDEAFLDCSGISDLSAFGHQIRERVLQWTGIPTSIGFGPTKVLAKIANHYAKKYEEHKGVFVLSNPIVTQHALAHLPVEEIWGVGRRTATKLHHQGIHTALELSRVSAQWMRQKFTIVGERLLQELQGHSCYTLETVPASRKSIQVTRSFGHPITTFEDMRSVVSLYASRAASKLRREKQTTQTILVFSQTDRFKRESYSGETAVITLPLPAQDDTTLIQAACRGLEKIFRPGVAYKKAGVMLMKLTPETTIQRDLFTTLPCSIETEKTKTLSYVMDRLNKRYGSGTLHMAACGMNYTWRDRKQLKSPAYTTDWKNLPEAGSGTVILA